jgi:hypothetical protein
MPLAIAALAVLFLGTVVVVGYFGKKKFESLTSSLPAVEPTAAVEATPEPEATPFPAEADASIPEATPTEGIPAPIQTALAEAMSNTGHDRPAIEVEPVKPQPDTAHRPEPSGSGQWTKPDPKHVSVIAPEFEPKDTSKDTVATFPKEPTLGSEPGLGDTGLSSAYESLDATRKPQRRLEKTDFSTAMGEARRLKQHSPSGEVEFLDTFSRAGVAFADGRDQEAWLLLRTALSMAPDSTVSSRRIRFVEALVQARGNMRGPDGAWIMGLAFDDVRGDLEEELDKALERSPNSGPVWYAKGIHAFTLGHSKEGAQAFKKACDAGVQGACNALRGRGRGR